jgi:hypothetical protein
LVANQVRGRMGSGEDAAKRPRSVLLPFGYGSTGVGDRVFNKAKLFWPQKEEKITFALRAIDNRFNLSSGEQAELRFELRMALVL